jgi:hypothetical protein
MEHPAIGRDARGPTLEEMNWADVREPGCYLHVATGLLARVRADEIVAQTREDGGATGGGQVVRLSSNPETPLPTLRGIAIVARYRVNF